MYIYMHSGYILCRWSACMCVDERRGNVYAGQCVLMWTTCRSAECSQPRKPASRQAGRQADSHEDGQTGTQLQTDRQVKGETSPGGTACG